MLTENTNLCYTECTSADSKRTHTSSAQFRVRLCRCAPRCPIVCVRCFDSLLWWRSISEKKTRRSPAYSLVDSSYCIVLDARYAGNVCYVFNEEILLSNTCVMSMMVWQCCAKGYGHLCRLPRWPTAFMCNNTHTHDRRTTGMCYALAPGWRWKKTFMCTVQPSQWKPDNNVLGAFRSLRIRHICEFCHSTGKSCVYSGGLFLYLREEEDREVGSPRM